MDMNEEIKVEELKNKYLYFEKKYIHHSLYYFIKNLDKLFSYMSQNDIDTLKKYTTNSRILYSNRLKIRINKELLDPYIDTLMDEKILVDVYRLKFTKNFIYQCGCKPKNISNVKVIDIKSFEYFQENELIMYDYNQIKNKEKFIKNVMNNNKYIKYLLHQDIHNSIISPILVSILTKNGNNVKIVQLQDITQIYRSISSNKIEMTYIIKKLFILNDDNIQLNIDPYLIMNIDFKVKKNNINIYLTY